MITFVHYHQIKPSLFAEHIEYYEKRYTLTKLSTLAYGGSLPRNPLFITFDDGWGAAYDLLPIYEEYPDIITIFVSINFLESRKYPHLTNPQIKQMTQYVNFQSHGVTHADITAMSNEAIKRELLSSKKIIESLTGKPVYAFAYPYNKCTDRVAQLVRQCGYKLARTGGRFLNHDNCDRFQLSSIGIPKSCSVNGLRYRLLKAMVKTYMRDLHVY